MNCVQYEGKNGPLPFSAYSDFLRGQRLIPGQVELPKEAGQVAGTFLDVSSENLTQAFGTDTQVLSRRYSVHVGDTLGFTIQALTVDIESDSIFIDVIERPADFGPRLQRLTQGLAEPSGSRSAERLF